MKRDHDGDVRECYWTNKKFKFLPAEHEQEVMFGLYSPGGGTSGEMAVRWIDLGGKYPSPQLQIFDDAWSTLAQFADVIQALADHDGECITPEQALEILVGCGFTDTTNEELK